MIATGVVPAGGCVTLGVTLGDALGEEVRDALGEELGDAVALGEELRDALGDELGEAVALGDPVALGDVGTPNPVQAFPFTRQLVGRPVPFTMNPKLVAAPPAIVAFQPAGVNVYVFPATLIDELQAWPTVVPDGSVSSTFQVLIADDDSLLTVTWPW
ncbi:hypothetical protein FB565_003643 [Actinoplanes lutulentus]|nr:hypothetical protein [Actinoplanes lutulentus]